MLSRKNCESCGYGYPSEFTQCIQCGASDIFAHVHHQHSIIDTECYANYWLCAFGTGERFHLLPGETLDVVGLYKVLTQYTLVSFNGLFYDLPMISKALSGASTAELKYYSDCLINGIERPPYGLFPYLSHIDLMNVLPGDGSLKAYIAKNHGRRLQDLPYDPATVLAPLQIARLSDYCTNGDIVGTEDLYNRFRPQLELRAEIGASYGINVMSKSDPQIAEAVFKSQLQFKVSIPHYTAGTPYRYIAPDWVKHSTLDVIERLSTLPFFVNPSGTMSPHFNADFIDWGDKQIRLDFCGNWVSKPKDWVCKPIAIAGKTYTMGIGGLHSNEKSVLHIAGDDEEIIDRDVKSYYPKNVIQLKVDPPQLYGEFSKRYVGWYYRRLEAKEDVTRASEADSLKTFLNGSFGKLGSRYSIFYAPFELINITLTGQLALIMLIERLTLNGIDVISANTDGVTMKIKKWQRQMVDSTIAWWEKQTGYETEEAKYKKLASRDVNNYIAIKTDGKVKLKGAYAPPIPGPSTWPNPTGQICVTAATEYLRTGEPILKTIMGCKDIREFVYVRAVKPDGAVCIDKPALKKKCSIRYQTEVCKTLGFDEYDKAYRWSITGGIYVGKIVRWYYGKGSQNSLRYKNTGNLVPRTVGCIPLMELPDEFPADIDYKWYYNETISILNDIGVTLNEQI